MAKSSPSPAKPPKQPGWLRQSYQVLRMTVQRDPSSLWLLIASFVLPVIAGVVLGLVLPGGWLGLVLLIVTGVLGGVLLFLVVLGRRAERAAYQQIEGRPGAVSTVLENSLRGGWTADPMPVAINPKTQDAVYRAVGRGGVVLIAEGPATRTKRLVDEQRRIVLRVLPNIPVHVIQAGADPDAVALHRIVPTMRRTKTVLRRAEVRQASNRLDSLAKSNALPIPKGMDPLRAPRVGRPR